MAEKAVQISGLDLVASAVVEQRDDLLALLRSHGWTLDDSIPARTLTGVVLEMLEKGGEEFSVELVGILTRESNFTGGGPELTVGADPVSAVAGAIGSVAELVRTAVNRKQVKKQAQAATLSALLQARQMPLVTVPAYKPSKQKPKKSPLPWIIGGLVVAGLATAAFIHLKSPST